MSHWQLQRSVAHHSCQPKPALPEPLPALLLPSLPADAGFLTILVQDEVPGLQMLGGDGRWQLVEPIPGALTTAVRRQ